MSLQTPALHARGALTLTRPSAPIPALSET